MSQKWKEQNKKGQKMTAYFFSFFFSIQQFCISQFQLRPAPPPPPAWPLGISIFFALDGKFPGVELTDALH